MDQKNQFQFLLYHAETEDISVNALVKDETIWLTQKAMAELFGVQTPAISKHLRNIFSEGELQEKVVVSKMEIPTPHGAMIGKTQLHETTFYNLDAIISVSSFIHHHPESSQVPRLRRSSPLLPFQR